MKLAAIIVFLVPVVVARHNHRALLEDILKSRGNLYSKVGEDVQNVMNGIFDELNLKGNFLKRSRIKLLLTMHYDLKSAAEKNFESFDKLVEAAKINNGNETTKGIKLFDLIEEILHDKHFNLSNPLFGNKTSYKHIKHTSNAVSKRAAIEATTKSLKNMNQSDAIFADSKEFQKFIEDFVKKVGNISKKHFYKSTAPNDVVIDEDLQVWKPPSVLHLDYVNDTIFDTRRIYRGKRSKIRSYPFLASVHVMGIFTCSGSIIAKDLVISAASCLQMLYNNRFYRENPKSVEVRVGSDYFARGGEIIPVMETFFHPSYDPKTLAHNLVVMRLYKQIRFSRTETRVKRIEYDRSPGHLSTNTEGIIVLGWGSRLHNNVIDIFEKLLVAQLDLYQVNECAEIYGNAFVTQQHFCAGFISSGGGACNKDLGGPGVVSGVLVGVISFGAPVCGAMNSPTVFTKLGYYAKWIDSIVAQPTMMVKAATTMWPPPLPLHISFKPVTPMKIQPFDNFMETARKKKQNWRQKYPQFDDIPFE